MKNKIEEVQEYFKQRIIKGEYDQCSFDTSFLTADIDGYKFIIWTGNGPKYCRPWESIGTYFMQMPEFTDEERSETFSHAFEYMELNAERIRLDRIAKLKSELEKLEI